VGGDCFDEDNVHGADEATSGEILDPIANTFITVADEYATLLFRGEFLAMSVIEAQIGRATRNLEAGEVMFCRSLT
jgi:hypothetical protein